MAGMVIGVTVLDPEPAVANRHVRTGPPIVLRRNEPVEITLVNHLAEATAHSLAWGLGAKRGPRASID